MTQTTIIRDNFVIATRVISPVSEDPKIPSRFEGLRHRGGKSEYQKKQMLFAC